ncbi:MAG: hypothetical protein HFG75_08130 [Hungatella sp.]|nr:hypothetical protein [Hungatella sp.]
MIKDLLKTLKALASKRRELSLIDMGKHDPDYAEAMSRVVELRDRYEEMELRTEDRKTIDSCQNLKISHCLRGFITWLNTCIFMWMEVRHEL